MTTYSHSTHLLVYPNAVAELAVICGNYVRRLRTYIFSNDVVLTGWERLRDWDIEIVPCVEPIVESKGSGMLNTSDNIR